MVFKTWVTLDLDINYTYRVGAQRNTHYVSILVYRPVKAPSRRAYISLWQIRPN